MPNDTIPVGQDVAPSPLTTPDQIAGLKAWWKADALALTDGAAVASWPDSSGSGNNLSQATASYQPTFKTGILNGKPAVRFNATVSGSLGPGNVLFPAAGAGFDIGITQPDTIFIVATTDASKTYRGSYMSPVGFSGQLVFVSETNGALEIYAGGSALVDAVDHTGAFHIICAIFSGGNGSAYVDGVQTLAPQSTGTNGVGQVGVGALYSAGAVTLPLMGDIAEIIVYNSALSTTDRQSIETYLNTKYNVFHAASNYTLSIPTGNYALTGEPVTLKTGKGISLAQGSYALTGEPLTYLRGKAFSIPYGAYGLTGEPVTFPRNRSMPLVRGIYTLTGYTLTMSQGRGYYLAFNTGVVLLSGQAVAFRRALATSLAVGHYALTGIAVTLVRAFHPVMAIVTGVYTLTGYAISVSRAGTLIIYAGQVTGSTLVVIKTDAIE
jgi:hypothetical protein